MKGLFSHSCLHAYFFHMTFAFEPHTWNNLVFVVSGFWERGSVSEKFRTIMLSSSYMKVWFGVCWKKENLNQHISSSCSSHWKPMVTCLWLSGCKLCSAKPKTATMRLWSDSQSLRCDASTSWKVGCGLIWVWVRTCSCLELGGKPLCAWQREFLLIHSKHLDVINY